MVLLLLLLASGLLRVEHIQEKADFLLANMAFFFLPAGVSIMNYFDLLRSSAVALVVICLVTTVVTLRPPRPGASASPCACWRGGKTVSELFYSPFFGVALSIFTFWVGVLHSEKDRPGGLQPPAHRGGADHRCAAPLPHPL